MMSKLNDYATEYICCYYELNSLLLTPPNPIPLKDYIPKCRLNEGVTTMEGGKEFYEQCLKFHLSLKLTPPAVHDLGRREVYRIRQRMEEVSSPLD